MTSVMVNKIVEDKHYPFYHYLELEFFYIPVDKINSWEHRRTHSVGMDEYPTEEEVREYYHNIPPVIVRPTGDGDYALIGEGNHRVNTCKDLGLKIPAYIIKGEK